MDLPMNELSDADVFDAAAPTSEPTAPEPQSELSDEAVFGSAEAPASGSLSEAEVFGDPTAETPKPELATPSIIDYPISTLKGAPMGIKGVAAGALQGFGAVQANPVAPPPTERQLRAKNAQFVSPEERAEMEARATAIDASPINREATPTTENPFYKAGTALGEWGQRAMAPKPGTEVAYDIGSGVGSVIGAIGLSVLSPVGAGLALVYAGSGEAAERAVKAGATPEQVAAASRFGSVAGATDVVDAMLPMFGTPGRLAGFIGKVGAKVVVGAFAEGGQEGLQQLIQNTVAQGVYKPEQDIWEGVGYNALIGAIVGGAAKPVLDRHVDTKPASEAAIQKAFTTLVNSPIPTAAPLEEAVQPAAPTPAPVDPLESLLKDMPKNPTEAHIQDSSPFSPGADASLAEIAPIATDMDKYQLRKERLFGDQVGEDFDPRTVEEVPEESNLNLGTTQGGSVGAKRFLEFVEGKENEAQLISQRIRQVTYDRGLRRKAGDYVESEDFAEIRNELTILRERLKAITPRLNTSKLTKKASMFRNELEEAVNTALSSRDSATQERMVKSAVASVAGKEAAGRTAVRKKIEVKGPIRDWNATGPVSIMGGYFPGREIAVSFPLIEVSMAHGTLPAITTSFHEGWHAIEGTLTRDEVNILRRDTEQLRRYLMETNPSKAGLYENAEAEEIWADSAAYASVDNLFMQAGYISPEVKSIMQKIKDLLARIREAVTRIMDNRELTEKNKVPLFKTSADIFEAFYRGEMAERRQGIPNDMLERWWAREAGEEESLERLTPKIVRNTKRNVAALSKIDPGITNVPAQIETVALHDLADKLFAAAPKGVPPQVRQALAHADQMAKRHKWMWGLDRLVDLNLKFFPLLRYAERAREMRTDATRIQDKALRIAKEWRRLGSQMENLAAVIDDISNMRYLTPQERAKGITRHPTQAEFQAIVKKRGASNAALEVFNKKKNFLEVFLKMTTQNAIEEAKRTITDPVALGNKIIAIQTREAELLSKPYFPFLRFGLHYVMQKDAAGVVVHFETFERRHLLSAERVQMAAKKKMAQSLPPGHTLFHGQLPESVAPFIGLPPELLESIQRELTAMPNSSGNGPGLSADQINAIEQLRYASAPAASFAHRFQNKDYTPGYSDDFLRAFSRYAFHGARYYSRVKYGWALRKEIANAVELGKNASDNKIGAITSYMSDHLYNTVLDTKGDFGLLKGGIFFWVFSYSVAGATLNLSQVPMVSYPWLAAKFGGIGFGDIRAGKTLLRAATQLSNFYKKGAYANQTAFEMRAIDYGVRTGRISESQASELAGLAQGNTLLGQGNGKFRRGIQTLAEKGTWMFEMAEQFNRRVTFRAALELAQKFPNSIGVKEAMAKYADEYAQLVQSGFNPAEARATMAAIHATEQTQFVYSRENRPLFMRGRLAGTVFVFTTYMLNVLQLMGANKSSVMPRQLIMLLLAGGIMALPGAEDFEDIINLIGKRWFGKDFNAQRALREYMVEMTGDKSDVILHGLARRGFGIPALMDLLGEAPGRGLGSGHSQNVPMPVLDRSKAISMGRILPIDIGALFDPTDTDKAISQQTQRAAGAVFGVAFNFYRAAMDTSTGSGDLKRWEKAMPRALASASRAYRAFDEEKVRGRGGPESGPAVVRFDLRDTEQAAEIAAMALGYTPLRVSAKWDSIMAQQEIVKKLQIEQRIVLQNRFEAQKGQRPEEILRANQAIRDYNAALPEWGRGYKISFDMLHRSMEARERDRIMKEAGVPAQRRDRPIADYIHKLFPESVVDVRKVR